MCTDYNRPRGREKYTVVWGSFFFFYSKAKEKSFYDKISYHLFLYVRKFG